MTLSNRDNMLATIYYEKADYVPLTFESVCMTGTAVSSITDCPLVDGQKDMFGIPWHVSPEGSVAQHDFILFEDIEDWEKNTRVPDLDSIDIKEIARAEMERRPLDRENRLVQIMRPTGLFQRMIAMMGFENALIALQVDPEECKKFLEVITDYMVDYNDRVIDAYGPDIYIYSDDVSTATGTFMSLDAYKDIFEPFHRRIGENIRKHEGVIAEYHECGKSLSVISLIADMGFQMWHGANPCNDLAALMQGELKGRMAVEGGWDPLAPASYLGATVEDLVDETRRCMTEYKMPGYTFLPFFLNEKGNSFIVGDERMPSIIETWDEMRWF